MSNSGGVTIVQIHVHASEIDSIREPVVRVDTVDARSKKNAVPDSNGKLTFAASDCLVFDAEPLGDARAYDAREKLRRIRQIVGR